MNKPDFTRPDVHPALLPPREPVTSAIVHCKACGRRFPIGSMSYDGLCPECERAVRDLERGRL